MSVNLSPSEASLLYDLMSDIYYNDDYLNIEREAAYNMMQGLDTTFGNVIQSREELDA